MIDVLKTLIERHERVSFAESMTGGALVSRLVEHRDASKVLKESYVLYADDTKSKRLNIPESLIETFGVVSKEIAEKMALQLKELTGSDLCVAVTGYAEGQMVNHAYVGISYKDEIKSYHMVFNQSKTRLQNIKKCVKETIKLIEKTLGI